MALINCPECGNNISESAPFCIHCGFQLDKEALEQAHTVPINVNVVLTHSGGNKITVIKYIRELTNLSLKESKEMVDFPPSTLKSGVSLEEAKSIVKQFESIGAKLEISSNTNCQTRKYYETPTQSNQTYSSSKKYAICPSCGSNNIKSTIPFLKRFFSKEAKTVYICNLCGNKWE